MLLKEYIFYRLFIFFISTFSFLLLLYKVSWMCKRDYFNPSVDISFYIMLYIINTMKINIRQFYTPFVLKMQKSFRFEPARPTQSTICSYTPVIRCTLAKAFKLTQKELKSNCDIRIIIMVAYFEQGKLWRN